LHDGDVCAADGGHRHLLGTAGGAARTREVSANVVGRCDQRCMIRVRDARGDGTEAQRQIGDCAASTTAERRHFALLGQTKRGELAASGRRTRNCHCCSSLNAAARTLRLCRRADVLERLEFVHAQRRIRGNVAVRLEDVHAVGIREHLSAHSEAVRAALRIAPLGLKLLVNDRLIWARSRARVNCGGALLKSHGRTTNQN
jgi:hypothetical protein